ncbi:hypothetical protein DND67_17415 [Pseudomonas syringae pv. pisi]|nr:hypothetical protein DND67_17415 [Pseudomonas syringae pv. pisi]
MQRFYFRAEFLRDVFLFLDEVGAKHRILTCSFVPDPIFPDVDVPFFAPCQLDDLLLIARSIEDAYVIVDSLETLS